MKYRSPLHMKFYLTSLFDWKCIWRLKSRPAPAATIMES